MEGQRLKSRVAIVTGGGRGLGEATIRRFASEGAAVVVADLDMEGAAAVARSIADAGGRSEAVQVDVTKRSDVERLVARAIDTFGQVDIMATFAGVALFGPILEFDDDRWEKQLAVNVTGTYLCAQVAARAMIERKYGRIITVSSVMGQRSGDRRVSYGTTKGAVIAFTKQFASEIGGHGVTVNSIAPGPVETELWLKANPNAQRTRDVYLQNIPAGRLGRPEDIASAAFLLASDDAAYITGQILNVDGGFNASGVRDGVF
jgi:NAD(P)-dependent dehydrogenase (short-subunit alcohol dehydrogenase family)